jgi:hypothetical protein
MGKNRTSLILKPKVVPFVLKVWRTIKLGPEIKVVEDFYRKLQGVKVKIDGSARDIMDQPVFAESINRANPEEECDLVLLTTAQLTGKKVAVATDEVFVGAQRLGLQKCPAWMGPKLRSECLNRPHYGWIHVGMEPIISSDGKSILSLEHDGSGPGLYSNPGDYLTLWGPRELWVFVRPRK